jgi:hypothetical protein
MLAWECSQRKYTYTELIKKHPSKALRSSIVGVNDTPEGSPDPFRSNASIRAAFFECCLSNPRSYRIAIASCVRLIKTGLPNQKRRSLKDDAILARHNIADLMNRKLIGRRVFLPSSIDEDCEKQVHVSGPFNKCLPCQNPSYLLR